MIARIPTYRETKTLPKWVDFQFGQKISEFADYEEWRVEFVAALKAWEIKEGIGREAIVGKVGNGAKVHRLIARTQIIDGVPVVRSIGSLCGSQKWSMRGTSRLTAFADDHEITCKKCHAQGIK